MANIAISVATGEVSLFGGAVYRKLPVPGSTTIAPVSAVTLYDNIGHLLIGTISADGTTIVAVNERGNSDRGTIVVYRLIANVWTASTLPVVGNPTGLGWEIVNTELSGDGTTLLVYTQGYSPPLGEGSPNYVKNAIYLFSWNGSSWSNDYTFGGGGFLDGVFDCPKVSYDGAKIVLSNASGIVSLEKISNAWGFAGSTFTDVPTASGLTEAEQTTYQSSKCNLVAMSSDGETLIVSKDEFFGSTTYVPKRHFTLSRNVTWGVWQFADVGFTMGQTSKEVVRLSSDGLRMVASISESTASGAEAVLHVFTRASLSDGWALAGVIPHSAHYTDTICDATPLGFTSTDTKLFALRAEVTDGSEVDRIYQIIDFNVSSLTWPAYKLQFYGYSPIIENTVPIRIADQAAGFESPRLTGHTPIVAVSPQGHVRATVPAFSIEVEAVTNDVGALVGNISAPQIEIYSAATLPAGVVAKISAPTIEVRALAGSVAHVAATIKAPQIATVSAQAILVADVGPPMASVTALAGSTATVVGRIAAPQASLRPAGDVGATVSLRSGVTQSLLVGKCGSVATMRARVRAPLAAISSTMIFTAAVNGSVPVPTCRISGYVRSNAQLTGTMPKKFVTASMRGFV